MKKTVALIILDGLGETGPSKGNAVELAHTPVLDSLRETTPLTFMTASGTDVGLPAGQMGNSEVGHLNIGAGRVVYQDLLRITNAIADGSFQENEVLIDAMEYAKKHGTHLHTWGLLSDGGVHSHIDHLKALILMAKKRGVPQMYIHAFMDGRDTSPTGGRAYVRELEEYMAHIKFGKIATISGRYYSMDRDKRWDRTKKSYDMLVYGQGKEASSADQVFEASYAENITDEFIVPTVIMAQGKPVATVKENDAIIFFNYRPDRARQITRAFLDESFEGFNRSYFPVHYTGFTQYDVTIEGLHVAYDKLVIPNTLGEFVSSLGKKQLRIAETEKYAHVTFFFNGGIEAANEGEDRLLIHSPKVATYDLQPEMSAYELTDRLIEQIDKNIYDLIICNYANPDMVGHTGVIPAAIKAVETVDECLGNVLKKLEEKGGACIVTADHGNAEVMLTPEGKPMTAHTTNQVPVFVVGMGDVALRDGTKLSDIAPTLLEMMELPVPEEMTGTSIIKK